MQIDVRRMGNTFFLKLIFLLGVINIEPYFENQYKSVSAAHKAC